MSDTRWAKTEWPTFGHASGIWDEAAHRLASFGSLNLRPGHGGDGRASYAALGGGGLFAEGQVSLRRPRPDILLRACRALLHLRRRRPSAPHGRLAACPPHAGDWPPLDMADRDDLGSGV